MTSKMIFLKAIVPAKVFIMYTITVQHFKPIISLTALLLYVGQIFFGKWVERQNGFGNDRSPVWIRALCTSSSESVSKLKGKLGTEGSVRLQCELRKSVEAFVITILPVKAKWENSVYFYINCKTLNNILTFPVLLYGDYRVWL